MTRDQITISQTVCSYLHPAWPLWLTWATMCTYRVETFSFFKTGTISNILSTFKNWKFKQSLTKMIARWTTWQDFPLKRKLYFCWRHRRKQVALSALTCCFSPFALWDLAIWANNGGQQRNQSTSPSNPHAISHDSKGEKRQVSAKSATCLRQCCWRYHSFVSLVLLILLLVVVVR